MTPSAGFSLMPHCAKLAANTDAGASPPAAGVQWRLANASATRELARRPYSLSAIQQGGYVRVCVCVGVFDRAARPSLSAPRESSQSQEHTHSRQLGRTDVHTRHTHTHTRMRARAHQLSR